MLTLQKLQIPASLNMYMVVSKDALALIVSDFVCHYVCNYSTSDVGVFGYIGVIYPEESSSEVWYILPTISCILVYFLFSLHSICVQVLVL